MQQTAADGRLTRYNRHSSSDGLVSVVRLKFHLGRTGCQQVERPGADGRGLMTDTAAVSRSSLVQKAQRGGGCVSGAVEPRQVQGQMPRSEERRVGKGWRCRVRL